MLTSLLLLGKFGYDIVKRLIMTNISGPLAVC
jgi:hypothetical protein